MEVILFYQHLFRFFAILKLYFNITGFGIISHTTSSWLETCFCLMGMVYAIISIGILFYRLAHHMYTVGMDGYKSIFYCGYNVL